MRFSKRTKNCLYAFVFLLGGGVAVLSLLSFVPPKVTAQAIAYVTPDSLEWKLWRMMPLSPVRTHFQDEIAVGGLKKAVREVEEFNAKNGVKAIKKDGKTVFSHYNYLAMSISELEALCEFKLSVSPKTECPKGVMEEIQRKKREQKERKKEQEEWGEAYYELSKKSVSELRSMCTYVMGFPGRYDCQPFVRRVLLMKGWKPPSSL